MYDLKAIIMAVREDVPNKIMPIVREYEKEILEEIHHDVISSN